MKINRFTTRIPARMALVSMALATTLSLGQAVASPKDLDEDSISNLKDRDVDGDGIPNRKDRNVDGGVCKKGPLKGKFVGDKLRNDDPKEKDIDGDGIPDKKDDDLDGDGVRNGADDDCDGDGKGRSRDKDDDGDGVDDDKDSDDDNDGRSDDDESEVEVGLSATSNAPSGSRVRAKVKQSPSGEIELEFDGRGLTAGVYDIVVNGQVLGTLSMEDDDGRTEGETEFETNPDNEDELPLPFTPFGLPVLIVKSGSTYFTGTVPTPTDVFTGGGDDNSAGSKIDFDLTRSAGLSKEAEASIELQRVKRVTTGMEVEVERIPVGLYDFIVNDTKRGTLSVVLTRGKAKGKLRYEKKPDGNGELRLDFAIEGANVVIAQGGTTFFSGPIPVID